VSAGQERILQLDPGIFRDLPTAVELGAEGRQAREQLSTLPAATNRLPQEGYGLQNLIPNRNHNENRQPRRGWDPLADLQQEAHSRNTRRNPEPNSQPGPGLPHHNSSRGNLGLVTQDSGSRHTETRTTEDGTVVTVDTYTTRDGSRVTEEHGSGFHRITIETLTGKRITVQSARGEDGRWVNVGTIREPIAKHTKVGMIWVAGRSPTLVSQNLKATTLTYLAIVAVQRVTSREELMRRCIIEPLIL
jgi:hypothetical protein